MPGQVGPFGWLFVYATLWNSLLVSPAAVVTRTEKDAGVNTGKRTSCEQRVGSGHSTVIVAGFSRPSIRVTATRNGTQRRSFRCTSKPLSPPICVHTVSPQLTSSADNNMSCRTVCDFIGALDVSCCELTYHSPATDSICNLGNAASRAARSSIQHPAGMCNTGHSTSRQGVQSTSHRNAERHRSPEACRDIRSWGDPIPDILVRATAYHGARMRQYPRSIERRSPAIRYTTATTSGDRRRASAAVSLTPLSAPLPRFVRIRRRAYTEQRQSSARRRHRLGSPAR